MVIVLTLSDKQQIRKRIVYDLVTLIAEVSGFADLWVLGFGSLIGSVISPKMLQTEVVNQMQFSVIKKKKKKAKLGECQGRLGNKGLIEIVKVLSNRILF